MKSFYYSILAYFSFLLVFNTAVAQNSTQRDTMKVIVAPPRSEEILELPIDEEPVFAEGEVAMQKFIKDNLVYPSEAKEKSEQGKVFVRFVVEVDGSITNVSIARGVSPSLDAEAIRIVKMMPKWKPGEYREKAVKSNVVIPIFFKL
jgi:TonB family protein